MFAAHPIPPGAQPARCHPDIEVSFGPSVQIMYVSFGAPDSGHDTSVWTGI